MLYCVSYDHKSKKSYTSFFQLLDRYKATRILENVWLMNSDKSAKELMTVCCSDLDENDGIFIAEITPNSVWSNTMPNASWLRK